MKVATRLAAIPNPCRTRPTIITLRVLKERQML